MNEKKIKRSLFATFINTTPSGESNTYVRMGKGVTEQKISYNPTVNSEQYIDEDSATSSVDGYAPSINTPQTCYKDEAVFEYIDKLRRDRAIGADAETDILLVYMYASVTGGGYEAEKNKVAISIEEFGGSAADPVSITYTLNFVGDPVKGTAAVSAGTVTFTEASA